MAKQRKPRSEQQPQPRYAKELFTHDTPYGHKVQRDRSKIIPRRDKFQKDLRDEI